MPITRTKIVMVLSIDGGGIRGIIPPLILREIEIRLKKAGKARPFSDIFHLIAGTSTGGLIALGLALPKSAKGEARNYIPEPDLSIDDIIELYEKRGQEIFPQGRFNRLRTVAQMFGDKYDEGGIEKILDETFKKATLKDALTNLLITSYETETMQPFCFKNRPSKTEWQDDENFYMRDAARAATAAPTYFIPARVDPVPLKGTFPFKGDFPIKGKYVLLS